MVIKCLEIIKTGSDLTQVKSYIKDMFKMLAHGVCTANKKRKQLIILNVPFKYRKVVAIDTQTTEYLFGDNLNTKVEEVEKKEKRASKLCYQDNAFLGQRNGTKRPGPHPPFPNQRNSQQIKSKKRKFTQKSDNPPKKKNRDGSQSYKDKH